MTSNNSSYLWLLLYVLYFFKSGKFVEGTSRGPHLEVDDIGQVRQSI